MNPLPDCSIIIPSFNTRDLTLACIRSIRAQPPSRPFEIIVVDNCSIDGTLAAVGREYPEVRTHPLPKNLGFGKACNVGARMARGRYLLFLNSDTESLPGTFDLLIRWLDNNPRTAIVGPELLSSQQSHIQMSWAWSPVLLGEFFQRPLAPYIVRRSPFRQRIVRWLQRRPRHVPIICGACIMIRREAFDEVHGFDEDFELYFEDSDLCMRCRRKGWVVDFVPHSKIVHHLGKSTQSSFGLTPLVYRQSQIYYYRKYAPRWAVPLLKLYLLTKWLKLWFKMQTRLRGAEREAARHYLLNFYSVIRERDKIRLAEPMPL